MKMTHGYDAPQALQHLAVMARIEELLELVGRQRASRGSADGAGIAGGFESQVAGYVGRKAGVSGVWKAVKEALIGEAYPSPACSRSSSWTPSWHRHARARTGASSWLVGQAVGVFCAEADGRRCSLMSARSSRSSSLTRMSAGP